MTRERNGQPQVIHWDRDDLIDLFEEPGLALSTTADGAVLGLIGKADAGECTDRDIELFSRRWMTNDLTVVATRGVLEAAVVAGRLRANDRSDLACLTALALLRGAWATAMSSSADPDDAEITAESARLLFEGHADALWEVLHADHIDPHYFGNVHHEPAGFAAYPPRCCRVVELIGLLALLKRERSHSSADEIIEWLSRFVEAQPGAAHPMSDHWAVALIPCVLALAPAHRGTVERQLHEVVRWHGNVYERALGLAAPWSDPQEEVERVIGAGLEHIVHVPRRESYLSSVVLDLLALLAMADLYELAVHEMTAVKAIPMLVHVLREEAQFDRTSLEARVELNVRYRRVLDGPAAPHINQPRRSALVEDGHAWDLLAVQSVVRDRHFISAIGALLEAPGSVPAPAEAVPPG